MTLCGRWSDSIIMRMRIFQNSTSKYITITCIPSLIISFENQAMHDTLNEIECWKFILESNKTVKLFFVQKNPQFYNLMYVKKQILTSSMLRKSSLSQTMTSLKYDDLSNLIMRMRQCIFYQGYLLQWLLLSISKI